LSPAARKKFRRIAVRISSASGFEAAQWCLVLTDDEEVRQLNKTYRKKDRTTDVLSFAMQEGPGAELHPHLLGDVVISVEQARKQAPDEELEAEIVRLMIHGLCHLRGFRHGDAGSRREMRQEEEALLEQIRQGRFRLSL